MADPKRPGQGKTASSIPPIEEEDSEVPTEVFRREAMPSIDEEGSRESALPHDSGSVRESSPPRLDQTLPDPPPAQKRPPIEVEFIQQRGGASVPQSMWGMLDIYTHNRVYRINAQLVCIQVFDRATGKTHANHAMLGARMGGGQRRDKRRVEISDPIPVPGMDVVFKQPGDGGKFGQTSRVERVVLRVRVSAWKTGEAEPDWQEITSQFSLEDAKRRGR